MRLAQRRRNEETYVFSDWSTPRRRGAAPSFVASLAVHSAVVATLWQVNPRPAVREFRAPTIEQILAEEERRIVWYSPDAPLPAVAPVEPDSANPSPDTPRYEFPQRMTANSPDPQSTRQTIVSDDPSIEIQQDLDLPNMLSWQAPEVERPRFQLEKPKLTLPKELQVQEEAAPEVQTSAEQARLQQLQFEELARIRYRLEQQRQAELARAQVNAEAAPTVAAAPIETASLSGAQFEELARLRYQGPAATAPNGAPRRTSVDAGQAPTVASTAASEAGIALSQSDALSRIRYRAGGGTPNRQQPASVRLGTVDAAPAVGRSTPGEKGGAAIGADFQELSRLRYRGPEGATPGGSAGGGARRTSAAAEAAPRVGPAGGPSGSADAAGAAASLGSSLPAAAAPPPSLGAPGGDQSGGTGGDRNLVVAGVNPSNRLPDTLPRGSRRGAFSAGPDGGKGGSGNPSGDASAGLRVPNLSIEGPRRSADLPGRGSIATDLRGLIARRSVEDVVPPAKMDIQFDPREINIENPFVGRPVYRTAINMPNVTSYRGDWIIQFAELVEDDEEGPSEGLEERASERPEGIKPPYPIKKVDPRYVADAVREQLEGEVILYGVIRETGEITDLTLVRGVDKLLDDSAKNALAQWVFEPARKDGRAVAVETLVRIPFHLDPSVKIRY